MEELNEAVQWIDAVIESEDLTDELDTLMAVRNSIQKIIEKTAFIVPKCPKCGSDNIEFAEGEFELEEGGAFWRTYLNCLDRGCEFSVGPFKSAAEAAKAFGEAE